VAKICKNYYGTKFHKKERTTGDQYRSLLIILPNEY